MISFLAIIGRLALLLAAYVVLAAVVLVLAMFSTWADDQK